MIVLTVKTLDSQNHTFTVDDDITVEEFKVKIAETVNIPAETQRIIYCGRVLQDDAKLNDYDVNGKVVHLVQRPPPSANTPTTRSDSPHPQRRGFRGFEAGNTMYLGSMAFPSNIMESQGFVPPPPTHSLAGSRLNVARRMLRRAEAVIRLLENPLAPPTEQPSSEEAQEEEVTPIIEARVIVPSIMNESIDEEMGFAAVQNSLFNATGSMPVEVNVDTNASAENTAETISSEEFHQPEATSTPDEAAALAPDFTSTSEPRTSGRGLAENASRTSEMSELLTILYQLQIRFAPFLERYMQFMADDAIVPQENVRQTQVMLTRVSEVMHFFSHAYHSLSDILVRVRTPPPRPLLCRPILIQHSALVQAGIPIQVEAQFNLERPSTNSTTSSTEQANGGNAAPSAPPPPPSEDGASADTPRTTSASGGPVLFPFMPAGSMRVHSIPFHRAPTNSNQRPQNQTNNNPNSVPATSATSMPTTATTTPSETTTSSTTTTTTTPPATTTNDNQFNLGNSPSLEFFMEVTPEVRGNIVAPPPEFLQSLMQMAGQIMNRVVTTNANDSTNPNNSQQQQQQQGNVGFQRRNAMLIPNVTIIRPTTGSQESVSTQSTNGGGGSPTSTGQNSQARGNTQTNPTTATYTRSTPRQHVHLAQQTMQGFDPFLPCNSHHVSIRRRSQQNSSQNNSSTRTTNRATTTTTTTTPNQGLQNIVNGIIHTLRHAYGQQNAETAPTSTAAPTTTTTTSTSSSSSSGDSGGEASGNPTLALTLEFTSMLENLNNLGNMPNLNNLGNLPNLLNGPTIADILQQLPADETATQPGESLLTDLIMLLSRNLTIIDMITLNTGNLDPLERVRGEMQNFFMTRILDGSTTPEAIECGVERLVNEMRPFFENFSRLPTRDNIDMVQSVELLFRTRLPDVINAAANLNTNNMRDLVNQCLRLARLMCALALYASTNGQPAVEETFQQIITSYMQGIPNELQNWTLVTSCANLRHFMRNLGIQDSDLTQYIVHRSESTVVENNAINTDTVINQIDVEPMECDESMVNSTTESENESIPPPPPPPPPIVEEDPEPLPNVVLGSESWHGQVPEDWVPIITRDVQRQRRQNSQGPFSDAYLSGMPTKRRKIVNSAKPQGTLPQVITESVRRTVAATGLSSVASLDLVAQGAGNSQDVQNAYRNLLRSSVQANLRDNEDFTAERFPNASNYFNNTQ